VDAIERDIRILLAISARMIAARSIIIFQGKKDHG